MIDHNYKPVLLGMMYKARAGDYYIWLHKQNSVSMYYAQMDCRVMCKPNRIAAGATLTVYRRRPREFGYNVTRTESALITRGTFDTLRGWNGGVERRARLKFMGPHETRLLELTPAVRARFRALKAERARRAASAARKADWLP